MIRFSNAPSGRHFLQIPGPTNVPDRILRAIDHPTIDHRGPEFGALGRKVLAEIKTVFKTGQAGRDLPRLRHRRLGGGAGQHALAGRPRADVRDRPFRLAVARHGRAARPRRSISSPATGASGADPAADRGAARARTRRTRIKAVCVVHNETSTGVTSRIGAVRSAIDRGRASGAAHGRHDLLARLDRLPPRRMGRRRHRRRLAEGPDAAAGPVVQRDQRQGAGGHKTARLPRSLLGLGRRCWRPTGPATFPTRRRPTCSTACTRRSRCCMEEGLDNVFARHDRHAEATRARGARLGARDPVRRPGASIQSSLTAVLMPEGHDADAFRKVILRALRHVARHRAWQAGRQGVPHRPSRRLQRSDAGGHAVPASRWA